MMIERIVERRVQIGRSWSGRFGSFIIEVYEGGRTVAQSLTEDEAREMRAARDANTSPLKS